MLETFRKRDNPRAPGPAPLPVRQPPVAPQGRSPELRNEPPQPELPPAPAQPSNAASPVKSPVQAQTPHAASNGSGGTARLIVGSDIKLKGAEITDCDTLIVEGQVDACMTSRVIEVAETGLFRGNVQVDFAEIRGRFEGELTAHKQLMIRASGRVAGKIRYGSILIEEGGELSGDVAVAETANAAPHVRGTPVAPDAVIDVTALRETALRETTLPATSNRPPNIVTQR